MENFVFNGIIPIGRQWAGIGDYLYMLYFYFESGMFGVKGGYEALFFNMDAEYEN